MMPDSPSDISRLAPRWLLAAAVLVVVGFSAICGSVLLSMRQGDERLANQMLSNLAASIDADIGRNIELYDLSLRNVAINVPAPEVAAASKPLRQLILFDHAATARHFGALQVMDIAGNVTVDSARLEPAPLNFVDKEFFKVHQRDPLFGLFISKPMLHDGAYGLVLSRRIEARDGSFLGVVSGFIRYSYFHEMMARLQLEPEDVITVIRQDGVLVMRAPFDMDVIGRDMSRTPAVQQALASLAGAYVGKSAIDGVQRLFVWREGSHPLIVIVGRATATIYGQWQQQALQIAGAMGVLGLIACAGLLLLAREMRKRALAENRMARFAMTDSLTGLSNRRHFDTVIEAEWQRALRVQMPLALLMVDADHFKIYNDVFGHQAGDLALSGIAGSLARHAQRASDCAARYGGEEFALILPGLSLAEAIELGERIRIEISASQDGGVGSMTVSIGACSMVPSARAAPEDLIRDADIALYTAKARGRNQTFPSRASQQPLAA